MRYYFYGRRGRGGICSCAVFFIILGFIFVYLFLNETRKFATYDNGSCYVLTSYLTTSICSRSCGSGCTRTYTCYYANWDVSYSVGSLTYYDTIQKGSYSDSYTASSYLYDYPIGGSYSCWYDSTDHVGTQWNKPNPFVYAIVLAIMFIVAVVFIILLVYVIKKCNQPATATTSVITTTSEPVPVMASYPAQPSPYPAQQAYPAQPYPQQAYPADPNQAYQAQYIPQPQPAPIYPPIGSQPGPMQ